MTVDRKGSTTSPSPMDSMMPIMSSAPPPKPSKSGETGRPSRPISARVAQTESLYPVAEPTIFLRDSKS